MPKNQEAHPEPPSDKKLRLEIRKLNEEITQLRSANTEYATLGRNIWPLASGILTIVITASLGYITWRTQSASTQQDQDKMFFSSVQMATDPKGGDDGRIAGIWSLSRYWHEPRYSQILASTLSAILVTDAPDATPAANAELFWKPDVKYQIPIEEMRIQLVRMAAAQVIGTAIYLKMPSEEKTRLKELLYGSAKIGSLGTVTVYQQYLASLKKGGLEPNSWSLDDKLIATREAIRKNWVYLEDSQFANHDLDFIKLYEADLNGSFIGNSDLVGANLCGAKLTNVNFTGSDLAYANLSGADLGSSTGWSSVDLTYANIHKVKNPPSEFNAQAAKYPSLDQGLRLFLHQLELLHRPASAAEYTSCDKYD